MFTTEELDKIGLHLVSFQLQLQEELASSSYTSEKLILGQVDRIREINRLFGRVMDEKRQLEKEG